MAAQGNAAQRRANEAVLGELLRRELKNALDSTQEILLQHGTETRDALLQQEAETREILLQKEAVYHAAVLEKLDDIQTTLSALANGSIQLGIQGMAFFGGTPLVAAVNQPANHVPIRPPTRTAARTPARAAAPAQAPAPAPPSLSNNLFDPNPPVNANSNADLSINDTMNATPAHHHLNPLEPGPPPRSRNPRPSTLPPPGAPGGPPDYVLARLRTVPDAWKEWKFGINDGPAVEELERVWGGAWRPTGTARVAFCRRKVIWDEVARLMRAGLSAEEACERLERLREGGSLVDLGRAVKARQRGRGGVGVDLP